MIVQSLWIGEKLSEMEIMCIESYIKNNCEFHLYVYNKNLVVPKNTIKLDASLILSEKSIFSYSDVKNGVSAFSNVFRYKLLYEKGGIWTDMDMICLKPYLTDKKYVFSSELSNNKIHVNVGYIKVPKKSRLMKLCYLNSLIKKKYNPKWGELGPKLFKKVVEQLRLQKYIVNYKIFCPIHYTEINKLFNLDIKDYKESYGIHLWNSEWNKYGINKNKLNIVNI